MKKILALMLAAVMVLALASCFPEKEPDNNKNDETPEELQVMSYEEYMAAEIEEEVLVEVYVQATQSWWFDSKTNQGKITVYAADEDGAYFLYEMKCSEEDASKLTPGTKIKVRGYKGAWAGEIEIMDATFEFIEGDSYVAEAEELTQLLGTDELINYQNQLASFTGLFVKKIEFKNGERGDDIYVTVGYNGADYDFCVESYLTSAETDLYKAVEALEVGDVVNVEGFLYWYEGVNTHITAIEVVDTMTYAEYSAAALDSFVVVETYVQATQSWWDNKITVYSQDENGGYFLYEMACTEADAAKLTAGAKIKVAGYKAAWAGEVEIMDCHFVVLEAEPFVATAKDVTSLLGTDELINYQNQFVSFTGLTVEKIEYKNGEPGDDIYVSVSLGDVTYSFCVERYLTAPDSAVYTAVGELKAGDVIDVEGFLYWYEGVNTHITKVTVK